MYLNVFKEIKKKKLKVLKLTLTQMFIKEIVKIKVGNLNTKILELLNLNIFLSLDSIISPSNAYVCKQVRNPCVYSRPGDRVWL